MIKPENIVKITPFSFLQGRKRGRGAATIDNILFRKWEELRNEQEREIGCLEKEKRVEWVSWRGSERGGGCTSYCNTFFREEDGENCL